ncbi:MAG: hypothetical protein KKB51_24585 [Candidatus Riflebacteria bacterium]|nr:hypothetical protein [Candidatus Riflebacteria bacterium]
MQEELSCITCGLATSLNHRFCRRCGTLLEEYSDEPEQKFELVQTGTKTVKAPFTLTELFIVIAIIGILGAIAIPSTSRRGHSNSRMKACMANMRVIMGAVEMYNMDNNEMLRYVDKNVIQMLVDGKYLKSQPQCYSAPPGEYGSTGDLAEDGEISCSLHGTIDNPKDPDQ